ncbi:MULTISPECIES: 50S ribosomal protein L9 [Limibacillus]|jgi:large subunit ribosomal protein L9|uniref:Large ribosomal subunit protein bL9 n=1 Tax=Limibacillus halophilus TaxID=1579333 RepID=A0A839SUH6_9PROT|nr:50S ribosomal protein L9 [Limibacillus halophilus]MBB3065086.1 large subunit ribosomal protein L9 [Limibacillus halophilus]
MEVILLERIEKLGQMGDVVAVKPGFARNYLLPQNKALRANKANLAYFETQRAQLEAQNLERKKDADQVAEKLEGLSVVIIRQAGDTGQLYGSVSARDIMEAVTEAGFTIERRHVVLDKAIKVLGLHPIRIRLHPEVVVEITVNVARSTTEAEQQVASGQMVTAQAQFEAEEAAIEEALELAEEADAEEEAAEDVGSDEDDEAKA